MRILLDTNIFLEIILDQKNANEAKKLLSLKGEHDYFVTDYSIHSIGLILYRREQHDVFDKFINDMVEAVGIETVVVPTQEMQRVSENAKRFHLDFDDAYQYVAAEKHGLILVSFDSDFDRTVRKRKTPRELV